MSASVTAYDVITERITTLLAQGTAPWQKPWNVEQGQPRNLLSKKPYRGINLWLLNIQAYDSPFWLTFNQAKQLDGSVRKGEKSTPIVFWRVFDEEDADTADTGTTEKRFVLRYFNVFNIGQTDGIKAQPIEKIEHRHTPIEICEKIVGSYPNPPMILHGGTQAFYKPGSDEVHMPEPKTFSAVSRYYSTLFHELTHSTGHTDRLDRATLKDMVRFGDTSYAREELVAEMGATYLAVSPE